MVSLEKVRNLSDAGRFDLCSSCTTSEYRKKYPEDALTQAALKGIYHAHITDSKTVPIFKTLMTNACTHDCNYCQNSSNCTKKQNKSIYQPKELAAVFNHMHKRNHVVGLFLSSGIVKDADFTTEKMIETVKIVRNKYLFRGYIHFKALPGVSYSLLKEAKEYANRISINLESTSRQRINELTSIKDYKSDILRRQAWIKRLQPAAGQTTQIVIGGAGETDLEVMKMMKWEYENMKIQRMYYSSFTPINHTPFEHKPPAPSWRSSRLYNIDWLYRIYNYKFKELKELLKDEMLPNQDPKITHANLFLDKPVEIEHADYDELIRVPGIGPKSARNIITHCSKRKKELRRSDLQKAGAILKRADPFIKVNGWTQTKLTSN